MTPKTAGLLLGAATLLLALGAAAPATAATDDLDCVQLSTGETACGDAEASICAGAGEGQATGLVSWTLRVTTTNVYSTKDYNSAGATPAFAGGGPAAVCTTATCTWATLYANGQVVSQSLGVC